MGIAAEPEEVEAVLHNLCGFHLAERDPVFRYTVRSGVFGLGRRRRRALEVLPHELGQLPLKLFRCRRSIEKRVRLHDTIRGEHRVT